MGSPVGRYAFGYRFQRSLCNVNILSSMCLEEEVINQLLRLSTFTKTRIYQTLYLKRVIFLTSGRRYIGLPVTPMSMSKLILIFWFLQYHKYLFYLLKFMLPQPFLSPPLYSEVQRLSSSNVFVIISYCCEQTP